MINSANITACDGSGACQEKNQVLNLGPGQRLDVSTIFADVAADTPYQISCLLSFSDGSSSSCPQTPVTAGVPTKIAVSASQQGALSVTTKQNPTPWDVNGDGAGNALDYAVVVANYGRTSEQTIDINATLQGDTNLDGKVDSVDLSIVLSGLGN